eukprot:jgi/Chrpa1/8243/Chrysochromulina_OHIO_Genome00012638-RA
MSPGPPAAAHPRLDLTLTDPPQRAGSRVAAGRGRPLAAARRHAMPMRDGRVSSLVSRDD